MFQHFHACHDVERPGLYLSERLFDAFKAIFNVQSLTPARVVWLPEETHSEKSIPMTCAAFASASERIPPPQPTSNILGSAR